MLARKKRKKTEPPSGPSSNRQLSIEPEYDNPHVVNLNPARNGKFSVFFWSSKKSIEDPPRNRFDLTNDNLSALFTVAESPQPDTLHFADNDEPTSFANEMMEKLDKFKIKKKLDFDDSSQATIPSVQDDRATCCTLKSFISEETISTDNIAPMVMTPSSKSGLSTFEYWKNCFCHNF